MPLRPPAGFVSANYDPLKNSNPPTSPAASAGDQTASVSFTAPTNIGGGAITNYYAISSPGQITASSVSSPITVTGLTNNTQYTFKVWAENPYGPSAYSAPTDAVTPVGPVIEEVFSTWLYTGSSSAGNIVNNIDLLNKGGLVWIKPRDSATYNDHFLYDTVRSPNPNTKAFLNSNTTVVQALESGNVTSWNANGFSLGNDNRTNQSSIKYVAWTFREQAKFFDIVAYTGNGANRTINHNLGSAPGCIIIKAYEGTNAGTYSWAVYHRGLNISGLGPQGSYVFLNGTNAPGTGSDYWNSTNPTSTQFSLGSNGSVNNNGTNYIAYLFAHDAGGFGTNSTDNVISCGSYTGNGSSTGPTVTLGWEPQLLLIRDGTSANNWVTVDNMRGLPVEAPARYLNPNTAGAETETSGINVNLLANGFQIAGTNTAINANARNYIYIAIRRGPMKVPTNATKVFSPVLWSGNDAPNRVLTTTNLTVPDAGLLISRNAVAFFPAAFYDRLRNTPVLVTRSPESESYWAGTAVTIGGFNQESITLASSAGQWNPSGTNFVGEFFSRAPGFFDVVCYRGTGSATTQAHNLGIAPEMMIVKRRNSSTYGDWYVYTSSRGATKFLLLNSTNAEATNSGPWNNTTPTASVFSVGSDLSISSAATYVAYLFVTLAGISKVGSYTGTGTTLQVNCGFTNGSRLVMIKRADNTGSWYVWDSARGIVAGNDPYTVLNTNATEVTTTDYVDTYSAGFEISSTAPAEINANGGTFIFLAIA